MKKVALHNLGCKVNSYEIEVMQQNLEEAGYVIVPFDQNADVYVVNTCSVTNIADRKSRQMLHKAKKENPEAVVIAAGCYVQTRGADEVLADGVDMVIGNNKKTDLVEMLNEYFAGQDAGDFVSENSRVIDINNTNEYEYMNLKKTMDHTRAYIKVQDGCNQFCSYCVIPYARGRVRSRRAEDVISEITELAQKGYREFVLTGIHLSSYGMDLEESSNLLSLIKEVSRIEGADRIRLGSLEPRIITEEFATELADIDSICPHFHLSLQSGCEKTLKAMNRHYTPEEFKTGASLLRSAFLKKTGRMPAITTDVIVGFPGETDEDFAESRAFLEDICFYETHIFKYSKRKGTRAALMKDQLSEGQKTERSHELLCLNEINKKAYINELCGSRVEVLIEEQISHGKVQLQVGYTKEYIRVAIEYEKDLTGQIVTGILKQSDIMLSGQNVCIIEDIAVK